MATLPSTSLETHPAGTTNVGGIINGNWTILEAIFAPATTGGLLNILAKALIRSPTLPTADAALVWQTADGKPGFRDAFAALAYAATVDVALTGAAMQSVALTGDITFSFSALAAGRAVTLLVEADASTRAITWPVGVRWLGAAPVSLPASKALRVTLRATGATLGSVWAESIIEP